MWFFRKKPKLVSLTLSVNKEMYGYGNHIILLNYNFVKMNMQGHKWLFLNNYQTLLYGVLSKSKV